MKKYIVMIVYIFVMVCCLLYCNWTYDIVVNIIVQTTLLSITMYSNIIFAKLIKFLDISQFIKNSKLYYGIYLTFLGILVTTAVMTVLMIYTKKIIYSILYFPVITSYHSCKLFCFIINSDTSK